MQMTADGELLDHLPVRLSVRPGTLRVLTPVDKQPALGGGIERMNSQRMAIILGMYS